MKPYQCRKRLEAQRSTATMAIKTLEREKKNKLKNFDRENAPLLAQM